MHDDNSTQVTVVLTEAELAELRTGRACIVKHVAGVAIHIVYD